jgi:hypothetical protein
LPRGKWKQEDELEAITVTLQEGAGTWAEGSSKTRGKDGFGEVERLGEGHTKKKERKTEDYSYLWLE